MRGGRAGAPFRGLISVAHAEKRYPCECRCLPRRELVVGAGGVLASHVVDFAVLVSCLLCLGAHFTPGDALKSGLLAHHFSLRTTVSTLEEEFHSPTLKGPAQYWSRGLSFRPSLKNLGSAGMPGCRKEVKLPSMGYQGLGHGDLHVAGIAVHSPRRLRPAPRWAGVIWCPDPDAAAV